MDHVENGIFSLVRKNRPEKSHGGIERPTGVSASYEEEEKKGRNTELWVRTFWGLPAMKGFDWAK